MKIIPARRIRGAAQVPGDKSISHRVALIAALAQGTSTIEGFATSKDCQSTLACLSALGVTITHNINQLQIQGKGLRGFSAPRKVLDAGNSGSTMRMLSGILAGQPFTSQITGDESLQRRPMRRIITPLRQMGATITAQAESFAPLTITGGQLKPIHYLMPVASAQVKSAILLAGLFAEGQTTVVEPAPTRNHSEIMLRELGATVSVVANTITILGNTELQPLHYQVVGDISSAAFLIAATLMLPHSELTLNNVGVNPSRRAIIDLLQSLGAQIELRALHHQHGEAVSDLYIKSGRLSSRQNNIVQGNIIPNIIDEIPILAVLATQIDGGLIIRDAGELRVKESDRIRTVVDNLRAMGAEVEEYPDGLAVAGIQQLRGAKIDAAGDHRIAMAFAIAGLAATGETEIIGSNVVDISFPNFFPILAQIVEN